MCFCLFLMNNIKKILILFPVTMVLSIMIVFLLGNWMIIFILLVMSRSRDVKPTSRGRNGDWKPISSAEGNCEKTKEVDFSASFFWAETMVEQSFKEKVRLKLMDCAILYYELLVQKDYLIFSRDFEYQKYYIVSAFEDNFLHLTGVHINLKAKKFWVFGIYSGITFLIV